MRLAAALIYLSSVAHVAAIGQKVYRQFLGTRTSDSEYGYGEGVILIHHYFSSLIGYTF